MKFYDFALAPSPRRVRIFLAEKGIEVPTVQIDLRGGEHLQPAFRKINPRCTVPVLELDDGRIIADIVAIQRYFEEIQPEPPLLGSDPVEKAVIAMWDRYMEHDGISSVRDCLRNSAERLARRAMTGSVDVEQIPALAERGRACAERFLAELDARLGESEYVAGSKYTVADITALVAVDFAGWVKVVPGDDLANLKRWHAAVSARPSAQA